MHVLHLRGTMYRLDLVPEPVEKLEHNVPDEIIPEPAVISTNLLHRYQQHKTHH